MTTPPRMLGVAVACVAAAMLFAELALTRVFSVLLYYHFSFFAVALAMSGLAFGGLWVARWPVRSLPSAAFTTRLADLALAGAVIGALELLLFQLLDPAAGTRAAIVVNALRWLPLFIVAGAFLATAFARRPEWIGELYAWDLAAAAGMCLLTIPMLRKVPGPGALFLVPLLFGLAAAVIRPAGRLRRGAGALIASGAAGALAVGATSQLPIIPLDDAPPGARVVYERWNEYSRVQGRWYASRPAEIDFVIDRSASTQMPRLRSSRTGQLPPPDASWMRGVQALPYFLDRPVARVGIIGVGGGRDLLPPIAAGAREVIGFEYNPIFIDLLRRDYAHWNPIASRPEVSLVHAEARAALAQESRRFDYLQASLTDTWAAAASGGLALAENGLYTLEGWTRLLEALTPAGVLTMTRWYLPAAPVEAHRLVTLAAVALERGGVADPRPHVVLVTGRPVFVEDDPLFGTVRLATILVSPSAFEPAEIARIRRESQQHGYAVLAAPGMIPTDSTIAAVLDPARRPQAIAAHPYDISAPTDSRPYFFLHLRPRHVTRLLATDLSSSLTEVSVHPVRVFVGLALAALTLTGLVLVLAGGALGDGRPGVPLAMRGYFAAIGLGYMLVQLGLHQRLIIVLGHPTRALSVVLFAMLIGTALGSLASRRVSSRPEAGWFLILAAVAALVAGFGSVPLLEGLTPEPLRLLVAGGVVLAVGFALGFGFPLGVPLAAVHGEHAVQRMWAVNGAASIAGAALAALTGLAAGSRATVVFGLACYAAAVASGIYTLRRGAMFQT